MPELNLAELKFNVYAEEIFQKALDNSNAGVIINGQVINNFRHADDTVIIATNIEDLERMLNNINIYSNEYGLRINLKKTKHMIISKNPVRGAQQLKIDDINIERVNKYQYLGTILNEENDHTQEVNKRIEMARSAFLKMKKILTQKNLNLELRIRMVRCYIFPILLYGAEAWTLKKNNLKRLESFELWVYRRMLRISWTQRVTNESVLSRMNKEKELIFTVQKRKIEYFGHIMRGPRYEILRLIMQGKIEGKRSIGRRRTSWLKNLREWFHCSSVDLFRAAASKVRIAIMIANLRPETAP